MFLSPVPGSPAEEQPPAADFYPQAKLGFGGLSMDDEGDARMSSPLATRRSKASRCVTDVELARQPDKEGYRG